MGYKKSMADELIEKAEKQRKLKKMSHKGSGLASLITGKEEIELLTDQVNSELPVLYYRLNQRREFYEKKDPNSGYVVNTKKDITKTEKYLDKSADKTLSLHDLRQIVEFINDTTEKYSFDV